MACCDAVDVLEINRQLFLMELQREGNNSAVMILYGYNTSAYVTY